MTRYMKFKAQAGDTANPITHETDPMPWEERPGLDDEVWEWGVEQVQVEAWVVECDEDGRELDD